MSEAANTPPVERMDINCDLGEGFGHYRLATDDDALLERITSANIACGWHAGDPAIMNRTVARAVELDVAVGAHPGLPDKLAFGRRRWDLTPDEAADFAVYQVGAMDGFARLHGTTVNHWKPHGGYYLAIRQNPDVAAAVAESLLRSFPDLALYHPGPVREMTLCTEYASRGGRVVSEIYVDTAVTPEFAYVVERHKHGADLDGVRGMLARWFDSRIVIANDGVTEIEIPAESICVHGDGANALDVLDTVRHELTARGVSIGSPPTG